MIKNMSSIISQLTDYTDNKPKCFTAVGIGLFLLILTICQIAIFTKKQKANENTLFDNITLCVVILLFIGISVSLFLNRECFNVILSK